jgi:hypothetical protein
MSFSSLSTLVLDLFNTVWPERINLCTSCNCCSGSFLCDFNVNYYPFDVHECSVKLTLAKLQMPIVRQGDISLFIKGILTYLVYYTIIFALNSDSSLEV